MNYIDAGRDSQNNPIQLHYEDYGSGQPVVLIHGWPLSHHMWEYQVPAIVEAGFRCIAYSRRGFGLSSKPWDGYNYDTLAEDLNALIKQLELTRVILVGFSMGGGEVARYVGKYGTGNVAKAVFLSSIAPFMLKTEDNPEGVPEETFEGFKKELRKDRLKFIEDFADPFFKPAGDKVSEAQKHFNWITAGLALPKAILDCVDAFGTTNLRKDMRSFDIPVLFIHGDKDHIVPIEPTSKHGNRIIQGSRLEVIKGGPHGCVFTHTDEVNNVLIDFLKE